MFLPVFPPQNWFVRQSKELGGFFRGVTRVPGVTRGGEIFCRGPLTTADTSAIVDDVAPLAVGHRSATKARFS